VPLIVCVRDAGSRARILADGRQRLENSAAQEHAAALIEIAKVANHRFADLVAYANPIATARARAFGRGNA
jgi:2-oxo-4-hydroxy-4-carboxy--5-ureidoimidazoline (OHCU) decarboxylase